MTRPAVWILLLVAFALGGCSPDPALEAAPADGGAAPSEDRAAPPDRAAPAGGPSASLQGPAGPPVGQAAPRGDTLEVAASGPPISPLGFGRDATRETIEELDIDVKPDGTGLPPGSGTAAEGASLYVDRCASCHGAEGHGTPAGWPLVGRNPGDAFDFNESVDKELRRTIGNYWPHAATVFDYTRRAMPADEPGSLTDDEVYALTAWMLWRNQLIGPGETMNAETLPEVEMPAADRFEPDDRDRD